MVCDPTLIRGALVVILMATVLSPHFHDQPCFIPSWVDQDMYSPSVSARDVIYGLQLRGSVACIAFGDHIFVPSVTAVLNGALFTSGARLHFHAQWRTWTKLYVGMVTVDTFCDSVVKVWAFGWCPQKPFDAAVIYALGMVGQLGSYAVAQIVLFYGMILCLTKVNAGAARRAKLFHKLLAGSYAALISLSILTTAFEEVVVPSWVLRGVLGGVGFFNVCMLFTLSLQISSRLVFEAREAAEEAKHGHGDMDAALRVKQVAAISAFSAATTIASTLMRVLDASMPHVFALRVLKEICIIMDSGFNGLMLVRGANFIDEVDLQQVVDLTHVGRQRQIEQYMRDMALSSSGPEVAIAAMMGGTHPRDLMDKAKKRFRSISWDVLAQHPEIIVGGSSLATSGPGSTDLFKLSAPCQLSDCDVFLSHAWDDDWDLKWAAIKSWCETFMEERGRPPRLWLDKVCVDQCQIDEDLKCLPIFVGACETLLVTSGSKYPTRLWCLLELFVYQSMATALGLRRSPILLTLGNTQAEQDQVRLAWQNVDISKSACSRESDKHKIQRIMNMMPGGSEGFIAYLHMLASELDMSPSAQRLQEDEESM